ncbi:MAG: hypothetical protein ACJAVM_002323 [Sulfitobacter sp.]|jgi:hypothetical protein
MDGGTIVLAPMGAAGQRRAAAIVMIRALRWKGGKAGHSHSKVIKPGNQTCRW